MSELEHSLTPSETEEKALVEEFKALDLHDSSPQLRDEPKRTESVRGAVEVESSEPLTNLEQLARGLAAGKYRRIVVMTGAGVSTSAGIPDFRSPDTGLYDNLQKFQLDDPADIFTLDFFKEEPIPFCDLARELLPGNFRSTPTHKFIKLLQDKGYLLRNYTQNIDGLEFDAGLNEEHVIQAHGGFQTCHCIGCDEEHSLDWFKGKLMARDLPICSVKGCYGYVKPDIVFFGENLPGRFLEMAPEDLPEADLLIVIGTSLVVHPFAGLIADVQDHVPRVLINMEPAGLRSVDSNSMAMLMALMPGQSFGRPNRNYFDFDDPESGDVFVQGACDDAVAKLVDLCGWKEEFERLLEGENPPPDAPARVPERSAEPETEGRA